VLLLVPKSNPKGYKWLQSLWTESLMFLDSFFCKYSEISL
jgi:hypothetical protein